MALGLVALLTLQTATSLNAQGVELGDGIVVTAKVVAIDREDRNVLLRGPEGNVVAIEVSRDVRNFDQIEVGDQVKVEYYESVALYLGQPEQRPEAAAGTVVARASKGEKPAGLAVEAVDVSATIRAIDGQKRTVTLQLPDGKQVTTRVDQSVKDFDMLKVGDSIHARYTEAMAISVEKP